MSAPTLITMRQLMERWQVGSRSTVYRMIANRTLNPTRIGGRVRFTEKEVERYERGVEK